MRYPNFREGMRRIGLALACLTCATAVVLSPQVYALWVQLGERSYYQRLADDFKIRPNSFDVEGAQGAGYSEVEILEHLATDLKVNVEQVIRAGHEGSAVLKVAGRGIPPFPPLRTWLRAVWPPLLGFLIPLGLVKAVVWVVEGFSKAESKQTRASDGSDQGAAG